MKKLVLILSFVFALGLFSVDAMSSKKVVSTAPIRTEQTAQKAAVKSTSKPVVAKKKIKKSKSTKKAVTPVKK
ncbi:MAG TPA: hypothetical protein VGK38_05270 [Prolixibacteraceae bacterium]|jgi:hypothetical protein